MQSLAKKGRTIQFDPCYRRLDLDLLTGYDLLWPAKKIFLRKNTGRLNSNGTRKTFHSTGDFRREPVASNFHAFIASESVFPKIIECLGHVTASLEVSRNPLPSSSRLPCAMPTRSPIATCGGCQIKTALCP
jgi:hypothetical protein